MNNIIQRKVCDSWYHHRWFRMVLLLVGVDMLVLGVGFAVGINPIVLLAGVTNIIVRGIIGIAYVLVAGYLIKHSLSYEQLVKETNLACQHCLHQHEHDEVTSGK